MGKLNEAYVVYMCGLLLILAGIVLDKNKVLMVGELILLGVQRRRWCRVMLVAVALTLQNISRHGRRRCGCILAVAVAISHYQL